MRILVTGGAGFIGSNLVRALNQDNEVVVLDNFSDDYEPRIKENNLENVRVELVRGDIRDLKLVKSLLGDGVEAVVHLAAHAGVRPSIENPTKYASTNVAGTATVLEALSDYASVPLVFAGSSSVYGARDSGPFRETDRVDHPASPYAATKRAAELLCYSAHLNSGLNVVSLRFFTVFGPRQRPEMAVAKFVRQILTNRKVTVYGSGQSIRDYTFISDAVRAIKKALEVRAGFKIINVGSGSPITLEDLLQAIRDVVGREFEIERLSVQEGDVPLTHADVGLAREILDWTPEVSLVDGLREYVEWYQKERVPVS